MLKQPLIRRRSRCEASAFLALRTAAKGRLRHFHPQGEKEEDQWLIIQGRAVGKPLAPLLVLVTSRAGFFLSDPFLSFTVLPDEQQPQPGPCEALY